MNELSIMGTPLKDLAKMEAGRDKYQNKIGMTLLFYLLPAYIAVILFLIYKIINVL